LSQQSSASPPTVRRVRIPLRYVISALATLLLLYLAFRGTDFSKLLQTIAAANYWWVLLSLMVLMISHALRAWRWRFLMNPIKPGIGFRNLFSGVMIGYLVNNVIPRGGELARPFVLGKLESLSKSAAFGTVVVERIIDIFCFLVLVMLLPVLYKGSLWATFPWLQTASITISVITGGGLFVLIALMIRRDWTDAMLRLIDPLLPRWIASRAGKRVHSFLDGLLFLKNPGQSAAILVLSILVWWTYALMTYIAFFAFGLQSVLDFRASFVLLTISSVGVAIPTPGGTGSYHALTAQALQKLFLVDPAVALSYATVTHAVGYLGVTFVGAYFLFRDNVAVSEAVRTGNGG
jgi:glycosyltransferase 2 family protein